MHSNERPQSSFRLFSWRPQRLTPRALTLSQQAKANAARAEVEAARPGEGPFYVAPHLACHPFPLLHLFVLAASFGGLAAAEGLGALNPLEMD